MYKWYLPTISEIMALEADELEIKSGSIAQRRVQAEREWSGAVAALNVLLHRTEPTQPAGSCTQPRGLILSGPAPILDQAGLVSKFSTWTLTASPLQATTWIPARLLPATEATMSLVGMTTSTLSLLPDDPLAAEQFCLVLTPELSLVVALGDHPDGHPACLFSFTPDIVWQCWRSLRSRLLLTSPQVVSKLDGLAKQFTPAPPDHRMITQFSRLLMNHLSEATELVDGRSTRIKPTLQKPKLTSEPITAWASVELDPMVEQAQHSSTDASLESLPQPQADVELLQAIAHEVRTPLTTIRTLTRLLLKRKDLSPDVTKRLAVIDQECTEQIDRFGLIFRAVELHSTNGNASLTPPSAISLTQVFQQNLPRWQQQVSQRDLTLEVILPPTLPLVLADSAMLEQMLTGLIDRISHSLLPGSHIQVQVTLAGHQLKLQFQSHSRATEATAGASKRPSTPVLKSIGDMLTFRPETGSLSLNLAMTKNLFQALGGKLIVRQRPKHSEELTIFLPLAARRQGE